MRGLVFTGWLVLAIHSGVWATPPPAETELPHPEAGENELLPEPPLPGGLHHDVTLELPDWTPADLRELSQNGAPTNLGGGLWPGELWPLMPEPRPLPPERNAAPPIPLANGGIEAMDPVPETLREVYFGPLPAEAVVDPQSLVGDQRQEEIADFVEDTASVHSGIPIRILVFEANQRLPDDTTLSNQVNRWFPSGPGLVLAYFMRQPQRALLAPSAALERAYAPEQLANLRDSAIREASVVDQPEEQLTRFCIKAAVRVYQMKRDGPIQAMISDSPKPVASKDSTNWWKWPILIAGGTASLLVGFGLFWFRRRKKSTATGPWLLPEQEPLPRLGAPHCGGHSAVAKFPPQKKRPTSPTAP